jgi:hypothetical protein
VTIDNSLFTFLEYEKLKLMQIKKTKKKKEEQHDGLLWMKMQLRWMSERVQQQEESKKR